MNDDKTAMSAQEAIKQLIDPSIRVDPYAHYDRIREAGPTWVEERAALVVAGYRDCEEMLRDPRLSSNRVDVDDYLIPPDAPSSVRRPWLVLQDPPDHTRLRRIVAKFFTVRAVSEREPIITQLADDLLDAVAERGEGVIDLVCDYAQRLHMRLICQLLGIPVEDEEAVHDWVIRVSAGVDRVGGPPAPAQESPAWLIALADLHRYLHTLVAAKRARPQDDLTSKLIALHENGDRLTIDELISLLTILLVAGREPMIHVIVNGIAAMLSDRSRSFATPEDVSALVEEKLLLDPPVQLAGRVASQDIQMGDVAVPEGASVFLLLAAAQRDSTVIDAFNSARSDRAPLAFGAGIHFCLGSALARLEARVALQRFAARVLDSAVLIDTPPPRTQVALSNPSHVRVRFTHIRNRSS